MFFFIFIYYFWISKNCREQGATLERCEVVGIFHFLPLFNNTALLPLKGGNHTQVTVEGNYCCSASQIIGIVPFWKEGWASWLARLFVLTKMWCSCCTCCMFYSMHSKLHLLYYCITFKTVELPFSNMTYTRSFTNVKELSKGEPILRSVFKLRSHFQLRLAVTLKETTGL